MAYFLVSRGCATCRQRFNQSAFRNAECKRGFYVKAANCSCTFHIPIVRRSTNSKRNIGAARGKSRSVPARRASIRRSKNFFRPKYH